MAKISKYLSNFDLMSKGQSNFSKQGDTKWKGEPMIAVDCTWFSSVDGGKRKGQPKQQP